MYVSIVPALLCKITGLHLAICGALATAFYTGLSLFLTYMSLQSLSKAELPEDLLRPLTAASLLTPPLLNAITAFDYGQREHFYVLFLLPYFLVRFGRYFKDDFAPPTWLTVLIGLSFGLTISYKPYFLLLPGALELYWLLRHRTLKNLIKSETLASLVAPLIYGAHFLLLPQAVRDTFFKEIAPLLVRAYGCFNSIKDTMVKLVWSFALSAYFISMLLAATLPKRLQMNAPLLILISLSLAIIELQQKFWNYHGIPLHFWTSFTIIFSLVFYLALRPARYRLRAAFIIVCCALFMSINFIFHSSVFSRMQRTWEPALDKYASKGDRILLLDCSDTPWFPTFLHYDLQPASHYLWLFAIPMREFQLRTAKDDSERRLAKEKIDQLFTNILRDEAESRPKFVMVRKNDAFGMNAIQYPDFATYLNEHGMDKILDKYEMISEGTEHKLYMRKENK